jgi:hypothetical protein
MMSLLDFPNLTVFPCFSDQHTFKQHVGIGEYEIL